MDPRLHALVEDLRGRGVEVGGLGDLDKEFQQLNRPWWRRLTDFASVQWSHVRGELGETSEAAGLLRRAVAGEELEPVEVEAVRAQLADLVRMVPASVLTLAIEAIPIPGTSIVTPWLLVKLGLLPSRWREARVHDGLQKEARRLRTEGQSMAADEVDALAATLTLEAGQRDAARVDAELKLHWDADGDGEWDPEELQAYDEAIAHLRGRMKADGARRAWFLWHNGDVFGPAPLSEIREAGIDPGLLVNLDGKGGWVRLADL